MQILHGAKICPTAHACRSSNRTLFGTGIILHIEKLDMDFGFANFHSKRLAGDHCLVSYLSYCATVTNDNLSIPERCALAITLATDSNNAARSACS